MIVKNRSNTIENASSLLFQNSFLQNFNEIKSIFIKIYFEWQIARNFDDETNLINTFNDLKTKRFNLKQIRNLKKKNWKNI